MFVSREYSFFVSVGLRSCVSDRSQVKRGPPDSSSQQTGASRTVKRYPSSSGPITSNALPGGNGYAAGRGPEHGNRHGHRIGPAVGARGPAGDGRPHGPLTNALSPAGKDT